MLQIINILLVRNCLVDTFISRPLRIYPLKFMSDFSDNRRATLVLSTSYNRIGVGAISHHFETLVIGDFLINRRRYRGSRRNCLKSGAVVRGQRLLRKTRAGLAHRIGIFLALVVREGVIRVFLRVETKIGIASTKVGALHNILVLSSLTKNSKNLIK